MIVYAQSICFSNGNDAENLRADVLTKDVIKFMVENEVTGGGGE